ncbi:hypothetical protein [Actinoplanes sp. NPDC048796]|uniref:hypothetical protein n=1 Tax=Actinoplanes sp. NPDC048796 TaxID=3155640 RepID=UPI003406942B
MKRLAQVRADPRLKPYVEAGWEANLAHLGLLKERARRYPVDDGQVLPTRLGNAIRRLEEYGYDRYRLDSQLLWYELNSSAPAEARKFADQARTTLDFLICLLYGNLMVAAAAIAALGWAGRERITLGVAAVILIAAAALWYRVAVVVTDDWAASVRALVNLGRKPLASSMGLDLPSSLADERDMWAAVSRVAARPYDDLSAQLDPFRAPPADTSLHVDWRRDTPSATIVTDGDGRRAG